MTQDQNNNGSWNSNSDEGKKRNGNGDINFFSNLNPPNDGNNGAANDGNNGAANDGNNGAANNGNNGGNNGNNGGNNGNIIRTNGSIISSHDVVTKGGSIPPNGAATSSSIVSPDGSDTPPSNESSRRDVIMNGLMVNATPADKSPGVPINEPFNSDSDSDKTPGTEDPLIQPDSDFMNDNQSPKKSNKITEIKWFILTLDTDTVITITWLMLFVVLLISICYRIYRSL